MALLVVHVPVVTLIPFVDVFVETIEPNRWVSEIGHWPSRHHLPIGGGWEICNARCWDVAGNKSRNWMADKHIGLLNVGPQVLPDIGL